MTIDEIKSHLAEKLSPKRYAHSISVAKTAARLAKIYGADEEKAYLAGVLHDCAKCYSTEELFEKIKKYDIKTDCICKESVGLVHGFVGACEAQNIYGVSDKEIYDAIYYHTIGKPDMPMITKIIYLADGIEPLRIYDGVDEIRHIALNDIDKAVVLYTDMTIRYVLQKGILLHNSAVDTRNFYLSKINLKNMQ